MSRTQLAHLCRLTPRELAEAIEIFAEELTDLEKSLGRRLGSTSVDEARWVAAFADRINAVPFQEHLGQIADGFKALADQLHAEADEAEEAADRRRDNRLEPDFRRTV